ncbi:uncharacterized protein ASCRUDRAFT_71378 [Ascoidea rubescens DSM 1968]|uniref:TATA element modulatory factor 1 TATA binding domain-containing protein n=1 Tax=Ascoidea rubescens DSM 1968 TaxID=1344418 RepID=A0A1D2VE31_9ASCO|nr:hypothetical protein ASCRUDRAFT_71378 [Ascoidea rubescens DSM 1968]ODV59886.1 hypothetical protein ASCRUDRAFT_71378 [Ascoidea rubescens DSM 1968]
MSDSHLHIPLQPNDLLVEESNSHVANDPSSPRDLAADDALAVSSNETANDSTNIKSANDNNNDVDNTGPADKPTKRLTMQERLSMAVASKNSKSKKKNKKKRKNLNKSLLLSDNSINDPLSPRSSISSIPPNLQSLVDLDENNSSSKISIHTASVSKSQLQLDNPNNDVITVDNNNDGNDINTSNHDLNENSSNRDSNNNQELLTIINSLNVQIQTLNKSHSIEISKLKDKLNSTLDQSSFEKKLKEKDDQINDLLIEGQKLSMTELKLTTLVKNLRLKELDQNDLINNLNDRISGYDLKFIELNESINNLKSNEKKLIQDNSFYKKFEENYNQLLSNYNDLDLKYKDLKSKNFEIKYKSQLDLYKDETIKNENLNKKINDLTIEKQLIQKNLTNQLNSLTLENNNLSFQLKQLKEENSNETSRLENKLEELRIINENYDQNRNNFNNHNNSNSNSTETNNSEPDNLNQNETNTITNYNTNTEFSSLEIKYNKLLKQNQILNDQYKTSAENFSKIELSLSSKINKLQDELNNKNLLHLNNLKNIRNLTENLNSIKEENNKLSTEKFEISVTLNKIEEKFKIKEDEVKSLQDKFKELSSKLNNNSLIKNNNSDHLNEKIKELEQENSRLKDKVNALQASFELMPPPIVPPILGSRNSSASSWSADYSDQFNGTKNPTAIHSRRSSFFLNNNNNKYNENNVGVILSNSNEDLNSLTSPTRTITNGFDSSSISVYNEKKTPITLGTGSIGSSNVQVISRMTNQIRSLKTEMFQIKEELNKNQKEKKEAGNEILRLLKDNERVKQLEAEKVELQEEIKKIEKQYVASLEILGEKSERVEELKADVMDLKELLRDQVQQIVLLQAAIKNK